MSSIPFIDIHTHPFREEPETITVQNIFPGERFAAFSGRNFYSVGLHPWHIKTHTENNESLLMVEDALAFDEVIFIGECGLDKRAGTNFEEQVRVFKAQTFMAEEFRKPLIVHCVKAYNEVLELYNKMHPEMPWILHAYNGSLEFTKQLEQKNFLFSFGENLFDPNAKAINSFKNLGLDKIFFETDEHDGNVEAIYKKGAELKDISTEEIKLEIWKNFNRIEKRTTGLF